MQGYGGLVKISTGCVEECCVKEEADAEDAGFVDAELESRSRVSSESAGGSFGGRRGGCFRRSER